MISCTFVTVNYYSEDNILTLLNSIIEIGINFSLIVVDSSLSFNPTLSNKQKSLVQVIRLPENRGYAYAANIGLKTALNLNTNYFWLLNPDVEIEKNSFNFLKGTSDKFPNSLIGSTVIGKNKSNNEFKIWGIGGYWDESGEVTMGRSGENLAKNINSKYEEIIPCNYVPGCSVFLNRETLTKIELIPEDYFLYFEETSWALQCNRKYGTECIIDQRAIIYHEVYEKKLEEDYRVYFYNRNKLLFQMELAESFAKKLLIILGAVKKLISSSYAYYKAPSEIKHIFLAHVYSTFDFLTFLLKRSNIYRLKVSKSRLARLR